MRRTKAAPKAALLAAFMLVLLAVGGSVLAAPTSIFLGGPDTNENNRPGASLGALSALNDTPGATHSFTLVSGAGDTDNARFLIGRGGELITLTGFDFEVKNSYMIRIRALDNQAAVLVAPLTIMVTNVVEAAVTSIVRTTPATEVTNADALTWTVSFSEAVMGVDGSDFRLTDPTNAELAVVATSGTVYEVTASGGNLADFNGPIRLSFAPVNERSISTSSIERSGLESTTPSGADESSYALDNIAPTVAITAAITAPSYGTPPILVSSSPFGINITFSENVEGFTESDIRVTGGTIVSSSFSGVPGGAVYNANIMPSDDTTATTITIAVAAGAAMDMAGHEIAASSLTVNFNPGLAVVITRLSAQVGSANPNDIFPGGRAAVMSAFTVVLSFTDSVTGFAVGDIDVVGGTAGTFASISASSYTAIITPTRTTAGPITIDVAANVATSTSGSENNVAATTLTIAFTPDVAPTITQVMASGPPAAYRVGSRLGISLVFSGRVVVDGLTMGNTSTSPTLTLETGATDRMAAYRSGSGSNTLTFHYDVQSGDESPDLNYVGTDSLVLNGATIESIGGTTAILTLPATTAPTSLAGTSAIVIDNTAPTVTQVAGVDGAYKEGDEVTISVTFNEAVRVDDLGSGTPYITLNTGNPSGLALYREGSGSATLSFVYTVQAGVERADLNYVNTNSLILDNASITDIPGNDAILTLPATSAPTSLAETSAIVLDNTAPTLTSIVRAAPTFEFTNADSLEWTVTFSEAVASIAGSDFEIMGGIANLRVTGTGTTLTVAAISGNLANLNGLITLGFANGQSIADAAGNVVADVEPTSGTNEPYRLDNTDPTVTIALADGANTPIVVGAAFDIAITFSEAVSGFLGGTDIMVMDGTVSNPTGTGTSYFATITPPPNETGNIIVSIPVNAAFDAAGNGNLAAAQIRLVAFDTTAPTLTITRTSGLTSSVSGTFGITITFNEAVSGFLSASDIAVSGGTATTPVGSGTTYYTHITPNDFLAAASITIRVPANAATDAAGNGNVISGIFIVPFTPAATTEGPSVTITRLDELSTPVTGTFNILITFSNEVFGFDEAGEITVTGGDASDFSCFGALCIGTITPTLTTAGTITIDVAQAVAIDENGNGNSAATQLSVAFVIADTTAPTVTITLIDELTSIVNGAFGIRINFSEPVTDFELGDIEVKGATATSLIGAQSSYIATISPAASLATGDEITIDVPANVAMDEASNANEAAAQLSITFTSEAASRPTVTITRADRLSGPIRSFRPSPGTNPIIQTFNVIITFSESVTGLGLDDFTVSNGEISALSDSGINYRAIITPTLIADGTITIDLAAGAAMDAAGNTNEAAPQLSVDYSIDPDVPDRPSVAITRDYRLISPVNSPFNIIITFSEPVSGFDMSDIQVTNARVTGFEVTARATSYSALISPADSLTNGAEITINVAANVATDADGNGNNSANSLNVAFMILAPTLAGAPERPTTTITREDGLTEPVGGPFNVIITFGEAVSGFAIDKINVANGTAGNLLGLGANYRATITPTLSATGTITIDVPADVAINMAGNGNAAANQFVVSFLTELQIPTVSVALASNVTTPVTDNFRFTVTFSEPVSDFKASDITLTNGRVVSFITDDAPIYIATIIPAFNLLAEGDTISIHVPAGGAESVATKLTNTASNYLSVAFDAVPTLRIARADGLTTPVGGAFGIIIAFSERVTGFDLADISAASGSLRSRVSNLAAAAVNGSGRSIYTATITPVVALATGSTITISVPERTVTDESGNRMDNLTGAQLDVPFASDNTAPSIIGIERRAPGGETTNADTLVWTVTFSEAVSGVSANGSDFELNYLDTDTGIAPSITPAAATIAVKGAGSIYRVTASGGELAGLNARVALGFAAGQDITDASLAANDLAATTPTNANESYVLTNRLTTGIAVSKRPISASTPFSIIIIFSEPVTGFEMSDITLSNTGTASEITDFDDAPASVYVVTITPANTLTSGDTITINVAANVAESLGGGNVNEGSNTLVVRLVSDDAGLSSLSFGGGSLTPAFVSDTSTYALALGSNNTTVRVTANSNDSNAIITLNGGTLLSGTASSAIAVPSGESTINLLVTAEDNVTTQTYSVTIMRPASGVATLSSLRVSSIPAPLPLSSGSSSFGRDINSNLDSVGITPTTTHSGAHVTVNGIATLSGTATSVPVPAGLSAVTIVSTAENGTRRTYTIRLTRRAHSDATLSGLSIVNLSDGASLPFEPDFAGSRLTYNLSINNSTDTRLKIIPTTNHRSARFIISGTAMGGAPALTIAGGNIISGLTAGINTINILVTSEDTFVTRTYGILVTVVDDPPVADAGIYRLVLADTMFRLNGRGSFDDGGTAGITYAWAATSTAGTVPNGRMAVPTLAEINDLLMNKNTASPSLVPPRRAYNYDIVFMLTASAAGATGTDRVTIRILGNAPPDITADAEPLLATEGNRITLTGTAADPDGRINPSSYNWELVSSTAAPAIDPESFIITNADALVAMITAPDRTSSYNLVMRFSAGDDKVLTGSADVTIEVMATSASAPTVTASAGPLFLDGSVDGGAAVTLTGTAIINNSDIAPDGYNWEFVSSTATPAIDPQALTITNANELVAGFITPYRDTDYSIVMRFTATSVSTFAGFADVSIAVAANFSNRPLRVTATTEFSAVNEDDIVTLTGTTITNGSSINPNGYGWVLVSSTAVPEIDPEALAITNANAPVATLIVPNRRTDYSFVMRFTATNNDMLTASAEVIISVTADDDAPTVAISTARTIVATGAIVALEAVVADVDGADDITPLTYGWTQTTGSQLTITGNDTASAGFTTAATPAILILRVSISDGTNPEATDTIHIITTDTVPAEIELDNESATTGVASSLIDVAYGEGTPPREAVVVVTNLPQPENPTARIPTTDYHLVVSYTEPPESLVLTPPDGVTFSDNPAAVDIRVRVGPAGGETTLTELANPIRLCLEPTAALLNMAGGDIAGVSMYRWSGVSWNALTGTQVEARTTIKAPAIRYVCADTGATGPFALGVRSLVTGALANQAREWLMRMGRSVADQSIDAVGNRGKTLTGAATSFIRVGRLNISAAGITGGGGYGGGHGKTQNLTDLRRMAINMSRDISFNLNGNDTGGNSNMAVWGQVSHNQLKGAATDVALNGQVTSFHIGADWRWQQHVLAGIALAVSSGKADLTTGIDATKATTSLVTAIPYIYARPTANISTWALAGLGGGETEHKFNDETLETDTKLRFVALGMRGAVPLVNSVDLAVRADYMELRTTADSVQDITNTTINIPAARISRARFAVGFDGRWAPGFATHLDVGYRRDAGDAEAGAGVDFAGGLAFNTGRFDISANGRVLLTHADKNYEDWGISLSAVYKSKPSGTGTRFSLTTTFGEGTESRTDKIWQTNHANVLNQQLGQGANLGTRMQMRFGYGITRTSTLLIPYTSITAGLDARRLTEMRIGMKLAGTGENPLELDFYLGQNEHNWGDKIGIGIGLSGRF